MPASTNPNTRFASSREVMAEPAERDPDYGDRMPRFEGVNRGTDDSERDTGTYRTSHKPKVLRTFIDFTFSDNGN
ncbi:hypothetical protein VTL71DRAFT_3311 [Oculimacula yallundae]|uniref:Uncharacterized protein n=1 Tax=Oculimacula yallundae TaxID=86028 RepID=A0ABR4C8M4_9HELO